jgi:predicted TIM-barrel enzyme
MKSVVTAGALDRKGADYDRPLVAASIFGNTTACIDHARVSMDGAGKNEREDEKWMIEHTVHMDGFFGASSIERLAAEVALTGQTSRFKSSSSA